MTRSDRTSDAAPSILTNARKGQCGIYKLASRGYNEFFRKRRDVAHGRLCIPAKAAPAVMPDAQCPLFFRGPRMPI